MPTTTFGKNIILDNKSAKRLAEILDKPAPPRPNLGKEFWTENERKVEQWLSHLRKS